MPVIRLLADGQRYYASPTDRPGFEPDAAGFHARQGDTIQFKVDAVGWAGFGDSVASAAWSGELTAASPTLAASVASALFTLPSAGCFNVTVTLTATSGRVIVVPAVVHVEGLPNV